MLPRTDCVPENNVPVSVELPVIDNEPVADILPNIECVPENNVPVNVLLPVTLRLPLIVVG